MEKKTNRRSRNNILFKMSIGYLACIGILAMVFGLTFAVLFLLAWGGVFVLYCLVDKLGQVQRYRKVVVGVKRGALVIFLIWFLSFAIVEVLVFQGGWSREHVKVPYIVILGAGLRGSELSFSLTQRLETSLKYIAENPEAKIYVSGGQGRDEAMSEAEAMRRYLVAQGVAPERIVEENKSTTTLENLQFTKQVMDRLEGPGKHEIMIITSDYHLFRSKKLALRNGFIAHGYPARTPFTLYLNYATREYFGVLMFLVF